MSKDITNVEPLDGRTLRLTFEGGEVRDVDIASVVPFDGVFAPLKDDAYFQGVSINPDIGTIVWPNGADLCPDVLYNASKAVTSGRRGAA